MPRPFGVRWIAVVLSMCLWAFGVPLRAAEPTGDPAAGESADAGAKAAILPLVVSGELSEVDRQTLTTELVDGLRRGAFDIVTPEEVEKTASGASSCNDAGCFKKIASQTGATHIVRAEVTVKDRDYNVRVQLIDGKSGTVMVKSAESCEICGITDAGSLMGSAAATLRTKLDALASGPATAVVTTEPAGAEVTIDGELAGVTPLERQVIPGKHVLRVSKEGYIAVEREVTFVEGGQETLPFTLEKVPSRLPARPWGWASLALGIGAIGVAVPFAVLDDRGYKLGSQCRGGNVDLDGDCRKLWDTEYIVLSTALVGATLVTLGVAVLLTTSKRKAKGAKRSKAAKKPKGGEKKAQARFGVGPTGFIVRGRF
jgi:hypothetical protein